MEEMCHRCGGTIQDAADRTRDGVSAFCAHCGAPQLYVSAYHPSRDAADAREAGVAVIARPKLVEWKTAFRCALAVAGVGALLNLLAVWVPIVSPLSSLWFLCASLFALGLYQRQQPKAKMNARVGARIGLVVGLLMAAMFTLLLAGAGLTARYGLHSMAQFDADFVGRVQAELAHAQAANPAPAEMMGFFKSAEFRVGVMMLGLACGMAFVIAFSTIGGAVGGFIRSPRKKIAQ